jgi:hypothetical protein
MRLPVFARYIDKNEIYVQRTNDLANYYTVKSPWKYNFGFFSGPVYSPQRTFDFNFFMLYNFGGNPIDPPKAKSVKFNMFGDRGMPIDRDSHHLGAELEDLYSELIANVHKCLQEVLKDLGFEPEYTTRSIDISWRHDGGDTDSVFVKITLPESQRIKYEQVKDELKKRKDREDDFI